MRSVARAQQPAARIATFLLPVLPVMCSVTWPQCRPSPRTQPARWPEALVAHTRMHLAHMLELEAECASLRSLLEKVIATSTNNGKYSAAFRIVVAKA